MASDPEAQTQLARLLRDDGLRIVGPDELREAVERGFESLVDGIVTEAAASDDVTDRESALSFVRLRLSTLTVLTDAQRARLLDAVRGKIEAW